MALMKALFSLLLVVLAVAEENPTFATCGDENSAGVNAVINSTVERLMEMRQPSWGWVNTPKVVLGLQLSAQKQFVARDKAVNQMKTEINDGIQTMNLGKLALYVLAVQSSCQNPKDFDGKDLVNLLEKRSRKQFFYDGHRQIVPFDRYYRFGLALGALCVNNKTVKHWVLRRVLEGQNADGSFGGIHSTDDAAQLLLALKCVESESRPPNLMNKVKPAVRKLTQFLASKITTDGDDVWIGNKYSSPSSALALMEEDEDDLSQWQCDDVMESLAVDPQPLENECAFSQRLPALAGKSYLSLKLASWKCETPVPIPSGYEPKCNPSNRPTCKPETNVTGSETMVNVRLTIYTDSPPSVGDVPNADVMVSVQNGSTLYYAMDKARTTGQITFESRTTSWGQFITSMQGVAANATAHEFWALIDGATGQLLPKGVSSYVPADGEQIVFRLKTW